MSIPQNQVVVGGIYLTATNQLRKVTQIRADKGKRKRVSYLCKSANYPNRPFEIAHTKASPPLLSTFARACTRRTR